MKKLDCEIVRDLLPSYIDRLTSDKTTEAVTAHLNECEACRAAYREMTNSEPPIVEQPEIDYLKKVNHSRRRIRNIAIAAACGVLALGLIALLIATQSKKQSQADAETISALSETNEALEKQTEEDAQTITELTETAEALQEQIDLPTVIYDAETRALVITGTDRYDEIVIPDEAENAISLDVQDDEFHLTMDLTVRYDTDEPLKTFVPGFLDRTEKSLQFLRAWFRENAAQYYDPAASEKMIEFSISANNSFVSQNNRDRIKITTSRLFWNRDTALVYAMMNCRYYEWEQIGYLQNLAFATDPYNEWLQAMEFYSEEDEAYAYYRLAISAGMDPKHITPEGYAILTDAIALYSIKEDWIHHPAGSSFEYLPVNKTAFFTAAIETVTNPVNGELTPFMAGSFIRRLTDVYGLDAVNAFVFNEKTFDEAFGVDYETARDAWIAWLTETYPIE